jgi:preprotein translocase subunit SecG
MFGTFAIIQVFICLLLIVIVLLQEGKKGMGAIFGGSSSSIFGARGAANILTRITSVLAILFMLNSVWLSYLSSKSTSVVDSIPEQTIMEQAPVTQPVEQPVEVIEVPQQEVEAETEAPSENAPAPAEEDAPAPVEEQEPEA